MLIALGALRSGRKNIAVALSRASEPRIRPRVLLGILTLCFALAGLSHGETLVAVDEGTATTYIEPLQNLPDDSDPTGWTALVYDLTQDIGKGDASNGSDGWQVGIHSVGMGDEDDNTLIVFDASVYSVYTRTEFSIPSAAEFQGMSFEVDFDDGYIAWLNGVEIHRSFGMEGVAPVWNSVTTFTHEASNTRTLGPPIELNAFTSQLVDGVNVLAIGTWNFGPVNADMTLIPRLTLFDEPFKLPDPFHSYLTWQNDTSTTMTVNYHTHSDTGESNVHYDRKSRGGVVGKYKFTATGSSHHIPGLDAIQGADRSIHVVELTGLTPGRDYYFVAGDPITGYTTEKKFRTLPAGKEPIRFVAGGDINRALIVRDMMTQAAAQDPMFALLGGDIAYADGLLTGWVQWETWLNWWEELMVTPGGHSIPIILSIGNHETAGAFDQFDDPQSKAPFYFGYFAQHGAGLGPERRAYFSRPIGEKAVLLVLDSGHVTPVDGAQKEWIENQLTAVGPFKNTFAVYHVPMYPSHRAFAGPDSRSVPLREHWLPLFDAHRLTVGFENHEHMLKRTKLLRANAPDLEGTLYVGDGCFGRIPRVGDQALALQAPGGPEALGLTESYLAAWSSTRHFWLVEIASGPQFSNSTIDFRAIDENGVVVDEYVLGSGSALRGPHASWLASLAVLIGGLAVIGVGRMNKRRW